MNNHANIVEDKQITMLMLMALVALEGSVSLAVEIIAMRQLIPFFGSNVTVAGFVIGFFLLFLATGYYRGGIYSRNHTRNETVFSRLFLNIVIASIFYCVGLSYAVMNYFFGYAGNSLVALTFYLLLSISPVAFFLGQTIPLCSNFIQSINAGHASGKILFISTLGSFWGALWTPFLFQAFGVSWAIQINLALLAFVAILADILATSQKKPVKKRMVLLTVFLAFGYLLHAQQSNGFLYNNAFANAHVGTDGNNSRYLIVNKSLASSYNADAPMYHQNFDYINHVRSVLFEKIGLKNKDILVLGAGGFTLSSGKQAHDNRFVYVDVDADLKDVSEKHFLKESIHGSFVNKDAYVFLLESKQTWDVVFLDVYTNQNSIPQNMLTKEVFEKIHASLIGDGYFVANIIANPIIPDAYMSRVDRTLRHYFDCTTSAIGEVMLYRDANIIYFCKKRASAHLSSNNHY